MPTVLFLATIKESTYWIHIKDGWLHLTPNADEAQEFYMEKNVLDENIIEIDESLKQRNLNLFNRSYVAVNDLSFKFNTKTNSIDSVDNTTSFTCDENMWIYSTTNPGHALRINYMQSKSTFVGLSG